MFGTIHRVNAKRGFGFIKQDQHGEGDIFFHVSGLRELVFSEQIVGCRVTYNREPGGPKGMIAVDIFAAEEEPAAQSEISHRS